jgi:hypothetical protein
MDIEEIKVEREKIENNIMNLINYFETITKMRVTSIQLNRMRVIGKREDFIYGVDLLVEL